MTNATRVTVSTFGVLAGLAGIEHGIGEVLQGDRAPEGVVILSWPGSEAFRILAGEPAMTLVPNLLASGLLAIAVSVLFLVWVTVFAGRRHAGLVLILLSVAMLLVGAGFGPPILGVIVGLAATRINAPVGWLGTYLSGGSRRLLSRLWPWCFASGVIAWLLLLPGTVLIDYFFGVSNPEVLVYGLTLSAFGLLLLTIVAGFVHDIQRELDLRQARSRGK
jgi:hypothetical protein